MIQTFTMAYPPQANHIFTVARGRKIMSSKYRLWRSKTAFELTLLNLSRVDTPFTVEMVFDRPDRRKRDLDNLAKPVLDAIKEAGIIADDSLAHEIILRWSARDPGKGAMSHVLIAA